MIIQRIKKINLDSEDNTGPESVINIDYNDNALIGVDLLANTSKKIEDIDNVSNNGYSSGGEESNKSNKEDFNFFQMPNLKKKI